MRSILAFMMVCAAMLRAEGPSAGDEKNMKILPVKTAIGEGGKKEVTVLFKGSRRTIVQITLRDEGVLAAHTAKEPITIHCITGSGMMFVGTERDSVPLSPSTIVTLDPELLHEIVGTPSVSVILSKFSEQ